MVIICFLVDKMEIDQIYTLEPLPLNQVRSTHLNMRIEGGKNFLH
jgi:hypothetical protein